ncbi:MAG TPA: hypothetical protein VJ063_13965 [Verrucomicrobiae bacterium]|nr:hypothetical protein [Verrucomicrobiae bacterium]
MANSTLLDAAYHLAKKAHGSSHAEAKDKLQAQFSATPWDQIVEAYLKGSELAEKCYEVGEVARRERIPDERALQILAERFPGFSRETYNDALTLGWFLSR